MVGIPKFIYVHSIIKALIEKDIENSLKSMEDVLNQGKDLENFLWEMIKHTKDILMYKVSKKKEIYSEEEMKQIEETSKEVSKEELINIIYKLSELENKMKTSSQKTIIFETGIIKLCAKIDNTVVAKTPKVNTVEVHSTNPEPKKIENQKNEKEIELVSIKTSASPKIHAEVPTGTTNDIGKIANWQTVIDNLKKQGKVMLYANLIGTDAVEVNDMTVEIRFYNGLNNFRKDLIQKNENMNALVKEVSVICGKHMQIKLKDASGEKETPKSVQINSIHQQPKTEVKTSENVFEDLGIEINYIDEE